MGSAKEHSQLDLASARRYYGTERSRMLAGTYVSSTQGQVVPDARGQKAVTPGDVCPAHLFLEPHMSLELPGIHGLC